MTNVRLMQGNEACAAGALAAGVRFFGGYPITPSTEIAEFMARNLLQNFIKLQIKENGFCAFMSK